MYVCMNVCMRHDNSKINALRVRACVRNAPNAACVTVCTMRAETPRCGMFDGMHHACKNANRQSTARLVPEGLDVHDLLDGLGGQHERVLFLHAHAVFDADAHAAERGRVRFRVGDVEATFDGKFVSRGLRGWKGGWGGGRSLRLDGDALPRLQLRFSRLAGSIVDV